MINQYETPHGLTSLQSTPLNPLNFDRYLTARSVSEMLDLPLESVHRMSEAQHIPAHFPLFEDDLPGSRRWSLRALNQWLESRKQAACKRKTA